MSFQTNWFQLCAFDKRQELCRNTTQDGLVSWLANQICLDAIQPKHSSMHAHSQPDTRRTSSRVVCRIQSLCNIVSIELYKLYVDCHPAPPAENIFLRVCIHGVSSPQSQRNGRLATILRPREGASLAWLRPPKFSAHSEFPFSTRFGSEVC